VSELKVKYYYFHYYTFKNKFKRGDILRWSTLVSKHIICIGCQLIVILEELPTARVHIYIYYIIDIRFIDSDM